MTNAELEITKTHEEGNSGIKSPITRSESILHGCYGVVSAKSDKDRYKYDSFMVYATADRPWVRKLVEQLEESKGYKICIECRDFVAGRPFSDNFQESVECSQKIVIVLSQAFLQSEWCDMVCQFAASHVNKIIPIKREECRCPQMISDLDFIDMTCEVALEYFWKKLVQSLEFQSIDKRKEKSNEDDSVPVTTFNVNIHTVGEGGSVAVGQGACVTSTRQTGNVLYENDDELTSSSTIKVPPGATNSSTITGVPPGAINSPTGVPKGATNSPTEVLQGTLKGSRKKPTPRANRIGMSRDKLRASVTDGCATDETTYRNIYEPRSMSYSYVNSQLAGPSFRDNEPPSHSQDTVRRQAPNQSENISLLADHEDGAVFSDDKYHVRTSNDTIVYHQQHVNERRGRWEVQPLNGVMVYNATGARETELNSFQNDVDDYLERFARMAGDKRETAEQFILQVVLSGLEKAHDRPGYRAMDSYRVLAKLSCCKNSPSVVKHSLSQLLNLLSRDRNNDYSDYCKTRIKKVEKIIRSSLIAPDGIFTEEEPIQHRQRLTVYSRLISLFNVYIAQGRLLFFTEEDLAELQSVIRRLESVSSLHSSYKKKDRLRYSVEFITEGIKRLLDSKKISGRMAAAMEECQAVLDEEIVARQMECLRMFSEGKMGWFSVHVILIYLHSQTHDNDKAISLIWSIVKAKQANSKSPWRTGTKIDWRFALIAATLLTDICMNHKKKDTRVIAGSILADYLKSEEMRRSAEVRAIMERHTTRALFCPDEPTIKILTYQLFRKEETDISCETLLKFLCWNYRNQSLETCETVSNNRWNFIKRGFFRGKEQSEISVYDKREDFNFKIVNFPYLDSNIPRNPAYGVFISQLVAVKVLKVKIQDILLSNERAAHRVKSRLTTEVYALKKVNETPHPNIVRVFGYNTDRRPYHVITEYMSNGNLLQFLRDSRQEKPLPPVHTLLQMCSNIVDGLMYLYSRRLIHIQLMAENILLREDLLCKIGGLHSIRQVKARQASEGEYSYSMDGFPIVVSKEDAESVPVRWLAPEAMNVGWFSIASEVWSLGVTLYEIFTYGCVPYLHVNTTEKGNNALATEQDVKAYVQGGNQLPKEACFEDGIYDLICCCCTKNQYNRPLELSLVKHQLSQLQRQLYTEDNIDERPRPNPPQLKILQQTDKEKENIDECDDTEPIYSTVDSPKLKEELHHFSSGRFANARQEPSVVEGDGMTVEWIDDLNLSHLRRLIYLDNPNLSRLLAVNPCGAIVELISEPATHGNLRDYVLANQCSEVDRMLFLSQIAAAMKYLHCQHIVHGELRAENVAVVIRNGLEVKVSRLGRSKPLRLSHYEVNSISCVVDSAMPVESIRWSAPEVIQSGHYTHAADVWSFGVLSWELYIAATAGQAATADDIIPYKDISDDEILGNLQNDHRLPRPALCPDWVHIITTQCCLYWRRERPPFIAILDCLTSSAPWESWIMQLWLKRHANQITSDWPDRTVTQPGNARHVLPAKDHPHEEVLWKMCSEEFLADHTYHYVPSHLRLRDDLGLDEDDPAYDTPYATAQPDMNQLRVQSTTRSTALQKVTTLDTAEAPTEKNSGLTDENRYYEINDVPGLLEREQNNPTTVDGNNEERERSAMALPEEFKTKQEREHFQHLPDDQKEQRVYDTRL